MCDSNQVRYGRVFGACRYALTLHVSTRHVKARAHTLCVIPDTPSPLGSHYSQGCRFNNPKQTVQTKKTVQNTPYKPAGPLRTCTRPTSQSSPPHTYTHIIPAQTPQTYLPAPRTMQPLPPQPSLLEFSIYISHRPVPNRNSLPADSLRLIPS